MKLAPGDTAPFFVRPDQDGRNVTLDDYAGYEILGVSPDPIARLAEFRTKHQLPFSLLSDEDHSMADTYGAWGMKKNYGREYEGLIRSTIVIDADGLIEQAFYNVRAAGHAERIAKKISADAPGG